MSSSEEKEEYFEFLDELRESGSTNMFGAAGPLREMFPDLGRQEAKDIVLEWMDTFEERHPDEF
jgi:hypothetical protein